MKFLLSVLSLLIFFTNCKETTAQSKNAQVLTHKYWSDGLAEINRYELSQNRYNNIHDGHVIQVFVTEDFLTDKQVKNESYQSNKSTSVLKRIETRHFNTGIYDYNMFSSAFTPFDVINYPKAIKITSTSQEWCGTTFTQLNSTNKGYKHTFNSYFEGEGDKISNIKNAVTEEELFTKLRMNPDLLPIGNFDLIPSSIVARLLHLKSKSVKSIGKVKNYSGQDFDGDNLKSYTINTPELNRTVEIVYESDVPYKIVGWTDTYPSIFDKKQRTTIAKLTHQIKEAYWSLNGKQDQNKRALLGLK